MVNAIDLVDHWPLIKRGAKHIHTNKPITMEQVFRACIQAVTHGYFYVVDDGFIAAFDGSNVLDPGVLHVFAAHADTKPKLAYLQYVLEQQALKDGYTTLQSSSFKTSGVTMRFFRRMKYDTRFTIFRRSIENSNG